MFLNWWQRWMGPIITMENGIQVRVGPQLGEGGFSFVFEATIVGMTLASNEKEEEEEIKDNDDDDDKQDNNNNGDDKHDQDNVTNDNNNKNNNKKNQNHNTCSLSCALKRIYIGTDEEIRQSWLREVNVHQAVQHRNLLPLLGLLNTDEFCYMLFPLCSHSLRKEVNQRMGLLNNKNNNDDDNNNNEKLEDKEEEDEEHSTMTRGPWSELEVLQLFLRICLAVQALHDAGYTHCDIKLENILIMQKDKDNHVNDDPHVVVGGGDSSGGEPILMDFGSVQPLTVTLDTRHDILSAIELASQQTTLPYRPPELLDTTGLLHVGDTLDYRAVDVWSLGCTLFAILYGASPMECEFCKTTKATTTSTTTQEEAGTNGNHHYQQYYGRVIKIVECTSLRILNDRLPTPPLESPVASWYSKELTTNFIPLLLQQKQQNRPTLPNILSQLCTMIETRGGHVPF